MSYELTNWLNRPSQGTPLSAANLLLYNTAINDLDVRNLSAVGVQTSDYTASAGQLVPADTSDGSLTITLPSGPSDKATVAVKHVIQGGGNTVTIDAGGSDVFNHVGGPTSLSLGAVDQVLWVLYDAGIWYALMYPVAVQGGAAGAYGQSVTNQSLVQLNHGLSYQPAGVICIDSQGNTVDFGAISYPMSGTCEITFGFPFTGQIYLS